MDSLRARKLDAQAFQAFLGQIKRTTRVKKVAEIAYTAQIIPTWGPNLGTQGPQF